MLSIQGYIGYTGGFKQKGLEKLSIYMQWRLISPDLDQTTLCKQCTVCLYKYTILPLHVAHDCTNHEVHNRLKDSDIT